MDCITLAIKTTGFVTKTAGLGIIFLCFAPAILLAWAAHYLFTDEVSGGVNETLAITHVATCSP